MAQPLDFPSLWDFDDPAGTETKFRALLEENRDADADVRAEILTQIARTFSLRKRFEDAQGFIDEAKTLSPTDSRSQIRISLEQGRIFNSSKQPALAAPFFTQAWDLARKLGEDALAVDAAHMMAIVETPEGQIEWNEKALEFARNSTHAAARRWRASLLNNLGWTYYDLDEPAKALPLFEEAAELRGAMENPMTERIARYSVGKCLRALGRNEEALEIQLGLLARFDTESPGPGFGQEEVAECLLALGRAEEAKPYFTQAYERLNECGALEDEPERLERLKELASK